MELILDDNRGNQIVLPFSTWNLLMRKQADVEQFLQSTTPPLRIGDLTIEMYQSKIVKLTLCDMILCT